MFFQETGRDEVASFKMDTVSLYLLRGANRLDHRQIQARTQEELFFVLVAYLRERLLLMIWERILWVS